MHSLTFVVVCAGLLVLLTGLARSQAVPDPDAPGPFEVGSTSITIINPGNGHARSTDVYYPSSGGQIDPGGAPYATLVFARGFLSVPSNYVGNGTHLASWGYIVFLADFPSEDTEERAADVQYLFSYLQNENANPASPFYGRIDTGRFGLSGHSLGGLTALMVSARDSRVRVALALDPVNPPALMNTPWDYAVEAPRITVPLAIIGAPSQLCNNNAGYQDIYPAVGSDHKALWVVANGSHCDFVGTNSALRRMACYLICGGQYSADRVRMVERYTTAWFNYYLRGQTDYFSYLYGAQAQSDIQAGHVTRNVRNAPRNFTAEGQANAVQLRWDLSACPLVAGYNVYRRGQGGAYPSSPSASVGRVSGYLDRDVEAGREVFYLLRSRDAGGNEHEPSGEVSAIPFDGSTTTPTATATSTASPTATASKTRTATATSTPTVTLTAPHTSTYTPSALSRYHKPPAAKSWTGSRQRFRSVWVQTMTSFIRPAKASA